MALLFNSPSGRPAAAAPASAPAGGSGVVRDGSTAGFVQEVIEASMKTPVVVAFWSASHPSSKTFLTVLEKLVTEFRGAVQMVRIDVARNQELAMQMRINGLPMVYAFVGGRPADGFGGVQSEAQVREFLLRLTGGQGPVDLSAALAEADALLQDGDADTALAIYQDVIAEEATNPAAWAGVLNALLAMGRADDARAVLGQLGPDVLKAPAVAAVRARLDLAEQAGKLAPTAELRKALAVDPDNHQARFDLAMAYFTAGEREAAVENLLDLVRRARGWNDDAARKQLLKLFEAFGPTDPLTVATRRKLSSLLFS